MFAVASLSASATSIRVPTALTVDFVSFGSGVSSATLGLVRKAIATELKAGKINLYTQKSWGLEGEMSLCVEANWETLAKLYNSFEKMAVAADKPAPKLQYHGDSCVEAMKPVPDAPAPR